FEPGCSVGTLSVALAARCGSVLSMDRAAPAVALASAATAKCPDVSVVRGVVPDEWPAGSFDLIVLGELGYYFDSSSWAEVARLTASSLAPGGHVVAAHWRRPIEGCSRNGDEVHDDLITAGGLERLARYEEAQFLVDVLGVGEKSALPAPGYPKQAAPAATTPAGALPPHRNVRSSPSRPPAH
ncbi:MAG: methyltransferase domain-containing protein, partial [Acidimicrobiales bacterium]